MFSVALVACFLTTGFYIFTHSNKVRIWIRTMASVQMLRKGGKILYRIKGVTYQMLLTFSRLYIIHCKSGYYRTQCRLLFPPAPKSIVCCNKHAFHCFRQPEISTNLPDCASILMKLINNQSPEANSISSLFKTRILSR